MHTSPVTPLLMAEAVPSAILHLQGSSAPPAPKRAKGRKGTLESRWTTEMEQDSAQVLLLAEEKVRQRLGCIMLRCTRLLGFCPASGGAALHVCSPGVQVHLAQQIYDYVDQRIRRLDKDIKVFDGVIAKQRSLLGLPVS